MDKKDYLKRLQNLKKYLKEHPEQQKIYYNLNIDFQILNTKRLIMDDENHVESRQLPNDFTETLFNPFL